MLNSSRYLLVFADKVRRAFGLMSLKQVAMPSVPPMPCTLPGQDTHAGQAEVNDGPGVWPVEECIEEDPARATSRASVRPAGGDGAVGPSLATMRRSGVPVRTRNPSRNTGMGEDRAAALAENEDSNEDQLLTPEEQYDCALECVALAFSEFLYWAMITGWSRSHGAMRTLTNISWFLSDQDETSNSDEEYDS